MPISQGAIQKVIDRGTQAIEPHYQAIKETARSTPINHLDETLWYNRGRLNWLWVMANKAVSLFMVHDHRSKKAFEQLIGTWAGILVSDNYGVYKNWSNQRQSCLAHLIRQSKGLAERTDPELARLGTWPKFVTFLRKALISLEMYFWFFTINFSANGHDPFEWPGLDAERMVNFHLTRRMNIVWGR